MKITEYKKHTEGPMRRIIILNLMLLFVIAGCSYNPQIVLVTNKGEIVIELDGESAPIHTKNFVKLVEERFYVGTTFHRVEPGFLIQGGDPNSKDSNRANDGTGGPDYRLDAEIKLLHKKGSVGAARLGDRVNPDRQSNGSQFYICLRDLPALDTGGYTVFGQVIKGLDVAEKIANVEADARNNPLNPVMIENVYVK